MQFFCYIMVLLTLQFLNKLIQKVFIFDNYNKMCYGTELKLALLFSARYHIAVVISVLPSLTSACKCSFLSF